MAKVVLRLLGECVVEVGGRELTPAAPHLFALALYLALERGRAVSRRDLERLLFPAAVTPRHASHNLRQLLYRLRRMGMPLEVRSDHIRLAGADLEDRFAVVCRLGYEERVAALAVAEPVMPGLTGVVAEEYLDWMERARDQLMSDVRTQLDADLHLARRRADWGAVAALARRVLVLDPLNETATLALAESLARQGSKSGALDLLGRYEEEVGERHDALSLPARLLRRRISEDSQVLSDSPSRLPFLGRGAEVEALQAVWKRARRGEFVVHALVGETGIGKTRLAEEFLALVALDNSGVVVSHALQRGDSVRPLALFADLVPRLLTLPGAAGCAPESLPLLRQLAEQREGDSQAPLGSAERIFTSAHLRYSIGELLDSVASERPLICFIDNADYLDGTSKELMTHLLHTQSSRTLFLLCHTLRPTLIEGSSTSVVPPLSHAAARALLSAAPTHILPTLNATEVERLLDACGGNPGHLELLGRQGTTALLSGSVPPDILHLIDRGLQSAPLTSRLIVQAVAVFGKNCRAGDLAQLSGMPPHTLLTALHDAEDRSLLVCHDGLIACRSALVADRALRMTSSAVAALLHFRAAERLSRRVVSGSQTQGDAWRIAHHWTGAGEVHEALAALSACWRHTTAIGQSLLAVASIREALTHPMFLHATACLLDELIRALESSGEITLLLAALDERLAHAKTHGEPECVLADLMVCRTVALSRQTNIPIRQIPDLRKALRLRSIRTHRLIDCARILMIAADGTCDVSLAHAAYRHAGRLDPETTRDKLSLKHVQLIYHTHFGDPNQALAICEEIDLRSPRNGDSYCYIRSVLNGAVVCSVVSDEEPPLFALEDCFDMCMEVRLVAFAALCAARAAAVCLEMGRLADAIHWAQEAAEVVTSAKIAELDAEYHAIQASSAMAGGDHARAKESIQRLSVHSEIPRSRFFNAYLSQKARLQTLSGEPVLDDSEFLLLSEWHEIASRFGRHDDEAEALWCALRFRGREEEAHLLLRDYLDTRRRERRAPSYFLRTATSTDPYWAQL